jgi:uncharacterized protein (DUF2336 family)
MNIPVLLDELNDAVTHGTAERRAAILHSIIDIFISDSSRYSDNQIELFDDIFVRLSENIEQSARAVLAHRMSTLLRAPVRLSRQLADDDDIAVAGPILQNSVRLDTATLVKTASTKTQQHLLAISRRSSLEEAVTDVLVERGDKPVVLSTANNPGARFSDDGYNRLVTRSEGDDELSTTVGLRADIPRQHLMRLLVQASHAARVKLETANPTMAAIIDEAVAEATRKILKQTDGRARNYAVARTHVQFLSAAGQLGDNEIMTFATENKVEEVTAALAVLGNLSIEQAERALAEELHEPVLIMAKGCGLSWPAVKTVLRMRAGPRGISPGEIEQCEETYSRLTLATSRKVISLQGERAQSQRGRFSRQIA